MTKDEWLRQAKKLHKEAVLEQRNNNGSGRCSGKEATSLNELQHAIGSHHGVSRVTYNELRASLDEMFDGVKSGNKKVS
jgi:hypothetical protein